LLKLPLQLGNERWENTSFNNRLQPTQIGLGTSATNQGLLKLNYDYGSTDNNGNIKSQTIAVPTIGASQGFTAVQTYSYDSLNRLKSVDEKSNNATTWKQTYTFDRYGNRRFDTANNNTTTLPANCQTTICNPENNTANNRLIGTTYDNGGNTTTDASGRTFIYDAENKQIKVRNGATVIGEYFYNGNGKRVKKVTASETTIFVYDATNKLVAEYSNFVETKNAKVSYLTNDHLGSPRILTDAKGAVISRRDFMPFGEEIAPGTGGRNSAQGYFGVDSIRQKFTGYERDAETDLDFAQARMYHKNHGRFTSPDPLQASASANRPQSWNRYTYSYSNPLRYTDPTGMIAGDFYNEDGNKIGTDGKNDGKIYLVTDKKEREKIEKAKGQPYTATVNSALELPSYDVRQEIGVAAVNRSNTATTSDTAGTFHEEGGTVWTDAKGNQFAVPAVSGAYSDPLTQENAQINVYNPANPNLLNNVDPNSSGVVTIYHVHPGGEKDIPKPLTATNEVKIGGSEPVSKNFVQMPSQKDISLVSKQPPNSLGYGIVVGARDKTVYFYKGSGNRSSCNCVGTMPLNKFISIR
jgi:RHS repeat-associated protein